MPDYSEDTIDTIEIKGDSYKEIPLQIHIKVINMIVSKDECYVRIVVVSLTRHIPKTQSEPNVEHDVESNKASNANPVPV